MTYRFTSDHPLRWVDVDSWGVVNHAIYLSLMEQARYEYFAGLDLLRHGQIPFVMAEVGARYHRPGRMGMRLCVGARVARLGGKSFSMEFEVRNGGDLLVTGSTVLVYVDQDLVPCAIPARDRERIAAFEGIPPGGDS